MRKTDGEWRKVTHSQREERGAVVGLDGCRIDAVGAAELDTGVELEREGGVETAGDAGPAAAACGGGVDGALEQRGGGVARGRGGRRGRRRWRRWRPGADLARDALGPRVGLVAAPQEAGHHPRVDVPRDAFRVRGAVAATLLRRAGAERFQNRHRVVQTYALGAAAVLGGRRRGRGDGRGAAVGGGGEPQREPN